MAAITSRKESRQRLLELFQKSVDRIIPEDDSVSLRGQTFRDFEDQAEELRRTILPALLEERAALEQTALVEERAALEQTALVESSGSCPFCVSERVYLSGKPQQREVTSPHGAVMLVHQLARCRSCGRSFSPAESGVGFRGGAIGGEAHATGGRAGGEGDGG